MSTSDLRKKAQQAWMSGKYDKALPMFEQLHQKSPKDLRTFVKLAEAREKLGDKKGAVADYIQIAEHYANDGFVVQAIAISKIILRIDPNRTEIQHHLRQLSEKRGDDWAIRTLTPQDCQSSSAANHDEKKFNFERTPLLSMLSGDELDDFIDSLSLTNHPKGDIIYKPGDSGGSLYLIGMGSVRLEAGSNKQATYAHLMEGDFFGEAAFMSRTSRMDTAIAESDAKILTIKRDTFDAWVASYPNIQTTVESFYCERVLARVLALNPIFKDIPVSVRMKMAESFQLCHFNQGDEIIRENEPGDSIFLIRSGHVNVFIQDPKNPQQRINLGDIYEGSFFGEVSLLTGRPRTASVVAACPLEVMELNKSDFDQIIERFPSVKRVVAHFQKQRVQDTIRTLMERS
ncbi:MAG: cyclic nucleotide-binding domain-containing protein [Mariprofundaceae bacterium]|nr:cyclic nucleotide-binding domain-containing protein [Mariprofundaceae bacterium]